MTQPAFVIEEGIAIPPRTIPNAGPRDSKYPVDDLKQGGAFAVALGTTTVTKNADGTETETFAQFAKDSDEALKQARQKQSQFSGLGRSRNITLVTRYYSGAEGVETAQSPFKSVPAPCLGIWHDGPAKEKKPRKSKKTDASEAAPTNTTGETPDAAAVAADPNVLTL